MKAAPAAEAPATEATTMKAPTMEAPAAAPDSGGGMTASAAAPTPASGRHTRHDAAEQEHEQRHGDEYAVPHG